MNIFVGENACLLFHVDPQDESVTSSTSLDGDHLISIAKERTLTQRRNNTPMAPRGRPIDIYVSLHDDLQHKLIIHTNEE
jgi:hypothetical protein